MVAGAVCMLYSGLTSAAAAAVLCLPSPLETASAAGYLPHAFVAALREQPVHLVRAVPTPPPHRTHPTPSHPIPLQPTSPHPTPTPPYFTPLHPTPVPSPSHPTTTYLILTYPISQICGAKLLLAHAGALQTLEHDMLHLLPHPAGWSLPTTPSPLYSSGRQGSRSRFGCCSGSRNSFRTSDSLQIAV